jgi:mycofactocin precursor
MTAVTAEADTIETEPTTDDAVLADVLIEEISIDGMCGVY